MTVPLLLLMTMLDNKSRLLLGFVLCGMVLAVCAYEINSLVCYSLQLSGPELSITAAPVIEEILKALPVLFFAVLVSDERKQILQLAMAVGIGLFWKMLFCFLLMWMKLILAWQLPGVFPPAFLMASVRLLLDAGSSLCASRKNCFIQVHLPCWHWQ